MAIRLIDTDTLCLTWFMGASIPKYAILSHTWEQDGEVSFEEMMAISKDSKHPAAAKSGYTKIVKTCQIARTNGIPYAWIDTCCINKTSSSELSEAINSMYRWYQRAEVCYALLADLNARVDNRITLSGCRWFTRGWCLQELIAPQNVEFFDAHWNRIGSKEELTSLISEITQIDEQVLIDNSLTSSIPVARRMSWAAKRETTRQEDLAYCLLGLFDVNMPMLYGEGPKAFMRLQEEIIRTSNDLSIFAFLDGSTSRGPSPASGPLQPYCNLFATSPGDFKGCGNLVYTRTDVHSNDAFALTNKGLHFRRAELQVDVRHGSYSIDLNCKPSESNFARIYLRKVGPSLFARYDDYRSAYTVGESGLDVREDCSTEIEEAYIITKVSPSVQCQLERADEYAIHVRSRSYSLSRALQVLQRSTSSIRWDASRMQFLTKGEILFAGYWKVFPNLARKVDKVEDGHETSLGNETSLGHFYMACGLELGANLLSPQPWVRLYSLEQWRKLETSLGIITSPNHSNHTIHATNINYTSDRITLGAGSTNLTKITATIRLEVEAGRPRFELELEFTEEPNRQSISSNQGSIIHGLFGWIVALEMMPKALTGR